MPSAARRAASSAGAAHSSVEQTSSEIGDRTPISGQQSHEADAVELPVARGHAVARQSCL